jgi:hypothetical protein
VYELLSNMPNQTNALAVAAVQQQAIAAMNTLVTSNTAADDGGETLDYGNDVNPSDGSPGMEMEKDEDVLENDDDDAFQPMDDEAEDPPRRERRGYDVSGQNQTVRHVQNSAICESLGGDDARIESTEELRASKVDQSYFSESRDWDAYENKQ